MKTSAFGLGFQHLPRDLANVNASKTMFDPYNIAKVLAYLGQDGRCQNVLLRYHCYGKGYHPGLLMDASIQSEK